MQITSHTARLWILVVIVAISGFSQGMLLPLLAVIFEQQGVSSSVNGLHATALYIGILLASPFMEKPLRAFGYKPLIVTGGAVVISSLALFPVWESFWFWFALRLLIGIGDNMLHFGTQTWITSFSPVEKRGRNISLYGLFFGLGFALGPFMVPLVEWNANAPFWISAALSLFAWLGIWFLANERPQVEQEEVATLGIRGTFHRFGSVTRIAWIAFLPPFGYGFLEASINGNFPVYALRQGFSVEYVSYVLLPAFVIGGIITQIPLGVLSDRLGRLPILRIALSGGTLFFILSSFVEEIPWLFGACFFVAGMFIGSSFSLGISYMTDLVPPSLLPAGNILCGAFFSFGSMTGPFIGGILIELFPELPFTLLLGGMLGLIFLCLQFGKTQVRTSSASAGSQAKG